MITIQYQCIFFRDHCRISILIITETDNQSNVLNTVYPLYAQYFIIEKENT